MSIAVVCSSCNSKMRAPDAMAGRIAKCVKCGDRVAVPAQTADEIAAAFFSDGDGASGPQKRVKQPAETKACMFCGEQILAAASKCKHCGEFLHDREERRDREDVSDATTIRLGRVSIGLGAAAIILIPISCIGTASLATGLLGLLLGIIGGVAAMRGGRGVVLHITGSLLSGAAVVMALSWTNPSDTSAARSAPTQASSSHLVTGQPADATKPQPPSRQPVPQPTFADRRVFAAVMRECRAIETDIEQGISREALDIRIRRLSTEMKLLRSELITDADAIAHNHLIDALDAYQTSFALWGAKNVSSQAGEHYQKTKAGLGLTVPQLRAVQQGAIMVRVKSINFDWDYTQHLSPYGLPLETVDGVTFAPADSLSVVWRFAANKTQQAASMIR